MSNSRWLELDDFTVYHEGEEIKMGSVTADISVDSVLEMAEWSDEDFKPKEFSIECEPDPECLESFERMFYSLNWIKSYSLVRYFKCVMLEHGLRERVNRSLDKLEKVMG